MTLPMPQKSRQKESDSSIAASGSLAVRGFFVQARRSFTMIENICADFVAVVIVIGACLVIAIPCAFIAYECKRLVSFLRRAYSRRRLDRIVSELKPMEEMIAEACRK